MSLTAITECAQALATGSPGRCYLLGAIAALQHGESPEAAFRLTTSDRIRERNRHLREAAALLAPDRSAWKQAEELARALRYFEGTTWARYRSDPARALSVLSGVKRALFSALLCGDCPGSQRRVYEALTTDARTPTASVDPR
jgi:hypothetical protein